MKILVVQDYLRSGGTERQSILLANAFAAAGHATTLLTFRPGGALAGTVSPAVARHALQPFDTTLDWFAPGLFGFVGRLAPDTILCMGRMANCYGAGLQQFQPGAALICTMRTGKSLPWLFRRSLRYARAIVANSRESRDLLVARHGIDAAKIAVIYNSLVFPPVASTASDRGQGAKAPSPRDKIRAQHGAGPDTLVLLCVAMFRPEKNQRELIEIAATLPPTLDWQLWLAGEGSARAACEQLAGAKRLGSRVKFLGLVRNPTSVYVAADVAAHASTSESLSNFVIEAQAAGLPAVACEAQGISECFVPGRTGWAIPRSDRPAFVAAVTRLATATPEERAHRAREAQDFARATFDPARQVSAYLELFARLRAPR